MGIKKLTQTEILESRIALHRERLDTHLTNAKNSAKQIINPQQLNHQPLNFQEGINMLSEELVENTVKKHPFAIVFGALGLGLCAAYAVRRTDLPKQLKQSVTDAASDSGSLVGSIKSQGSELAQDLVSKLFGVVKLRAQEALESALKPKPNEDPSLENHRDMLH